MANNNKSKKAKVIKQKKQMDPEVKRNLTNTFKSIISNQACVDGGKEAPCWIAVIFLIISIVLPVIPILVTQTKTYGSSFLASYSYEVDRGLANTTKKLNDDGFVITAKDGLLSFSGTVSEDSDHPVAEDIYQDTAANESYYLFRFYVTNKTGNELTSFINNVSTNKFVKKSTTKYDPVHVSMEEYTDDDLYIPSFIILTPTTMVMNVYKVQTVTVAGSTYGGLNWNHTANGNLLERMLTVDPTLTTDAQKQKAVYENWKGVLNETFIDQKNINTRNTTLIYTGVYAGLILFLGLMVFLLTRGRSNPNRNINILKCQFIVWWASFTPAVLGMILGFVFSTNMIGQMGFIVFMSIRIMWLSMRQLRPLQ